MSEELFVHSVSRRLTGTVCPKCGKPADGGTGIDNQSCRDPKPGDAAVCLYCGALNIYDELGLRPPTRPERRKLARDPRLRRLLEIVTDAAQACRRQWH